MAIKNTMIDLNNHLFEQLERLNDEELSDEKLAKEIERSKAMVGVADKIINNANLVLKATELELEYSRTPKEIPPMLIGYEERKK